MILCKGARNDASISIPKVRTPGWFDFRDTEMSDGVLWPRSIQMALGGGLRQAIRSLGDRNDGSRPRNRFVCQHVRLTCLFVLHITRKKFSRHCLENRDKLRFGAFARHVWQIGWSGTPDAKYSRTLHTVIRSPRMHGFPLLLPGSRVIRSKRFVFPSYSEAGSEVVGQVVDCERVHEHQHHLYRT